MKKLKFILNILIFILGISTLLLITIPLFLKYGEKFIEEKEIF